MNILKATMRVAQVSRPGGPLELVERPIPDPGPGSVRIKVQACGICHSDAMTKEGLWPGITFPRVPGHEVVGVIDAAGQDVPERWQPGQRVGVGWHAWHCFSCDNCRRGDFFACQTGAQVTGISFDGGYADYLVAPATALARVPAQLPAPDAAPLMCAGVTTFNALRNSGARPGDLVAVLGLGGLGHLGVQYAARMGFRTAAIARGKDKEPLARQLGAAHYIDSQAADPAAELAKLGGAKVVLATVTHGPAMSATVGGLAARPADGPGGRRVTGDLPVPAHRGPPVRRGLVRRHVHRLGGHAGVQRPVRCPFDERSVPPGTGRRGLRPHDERQGALPGRADDVKPGGLNDDAPHSCHGRRGPGWRRGRPRLDGAMRRGRPPPVHAPSRREDKRAKASSGNASAYRICRHDCCSR